MNAANVEAFLELLFTDSADAGTPVVGKPGIVQYPFRTFEEGDLHLSTYDGTEHHPFTLDSESHGQAFDAAMLAILSLRRYWRETSEFYEGKCPEEVLRSMASDVSHVVALLEVVRANLRSLEATGNTLSNRVEQEEIASKKANAERLVAEKRAIAQETQLAKARRRVALMNVLTATPVEQLAGLDRVDRQQQQPEEGAESK